MRVTSWADLLTQAIPVSVLHRPLSPPHKATNVPTRSSPFPLSLQQTLQTGAYLTFLIIILGPPFTQFISTRQSSLARFFFLSVLSARHQHETHCSVDRFSSLSRRHRQCQDPQGWLEKDSERGLYCRMPPPSTLFGSMG